VAEGGARVARGRTVWDAAAVPVANSHADDTLVQRRRGSPALLVNPTGGRRTHLHSMLLGAHQERNAGLTGRKQSIVDTYRARNRPPRRWRHSPARDPTKSGQLRAA